METKCLESEAEDAGNLMAMSLLNEWDFADFCSLLIPFHHRQFS
jgi:hypothetical protein